MKAHLLLWSKWNLAPSDQYRPDHVLVFSIVCAHCQATLYVVSLTFSAPTYNWDHATLVFLWRVPGWGVNYGASPSCWATSVRGLRSVCFSLLQLSEEELSHHSHETGARLNRATWREWPDSAWHMGCVPKQLVTLTTLILPWTSASISVKGNHNCICLSLGFDCWEETPWPWQLWYRKHLFGVACLLFQRFSPLSFGGGAWRCAARCGAGAESTTSYGLQEVYWPSHWAKRMQRRP